MGLLLITSLLTGLAFYVYARPVYYARSLLLLDQSGAAGPQSAIRELSTPVLAERTARRLGLRGSAREIGSRFVFKQSLRPDGDSALEMKVWAVSAELASRWSKELVEELAGDADRLRYRSLEEMIAAYGKELREVAAKLGEPLDPNFVIKSQADVVRVLSLLQKSAPAELVRMGQRLNEIGRVRISLIDPSLGPVEKLLLIRSLEQESVPNLQELGREQERLAEELGAAERAEPRDEERVRGLAERLAEAREKINAQYAEGRARIDAEYQALLEQKAELERKMPEADTAGDGAGERRQRAAISTMSRTPWSEMAAEMQRKIEALDHTGRTGVPRVRFDRHLEQPQTPLAPSTAAIGGTALAAGLVLALLVPLLLEAIRGRFSGTRRAEARLGLRALGTVPPFAAGSVAIRQSFDAILGNLLASGSPRVLMVTSALPREGKTVAAMQLAIASAATGTKTLLLDGDLRTGRVHHLFGFRPIPGLSDVLLGHVSREIACRPAPQENLSILAAGRMPEDPAALVGSQEFTELMSAFREEFACVILDAPSVLGLSETAILQRQVDGVLFVVPEGGAPRGKLERAHEALHVNGARFLGFVVNAGPSSVESDAQLQRA